MSEAIKDILIVDDEEQMRLALRRMLEKEGYSVREAENGDKAIRIHREKQADLIITDIIMPDKEGLGTILEIKSEFPDTKIFAMSGGTVSTKSFNLSKLGIYHVLKPFV